MNTANTCAMATRTNQKSDNNHEQARMNEMTTYARQGKVNEIKRLLDEGVCPNLVMTKSGSSLLMEIVRFRGCVEIAKLLIERGADIFAHDNRGCRALNEAARCGRDDIISYLITIEMELRGSLLNVDSLFLSAVEGGNDTFTATFLETYDANVEAKDSQMKSGLIIAASNGNLSIMEILCEHHADLESKDAEGRTALITACHCGQLEVVEFLLLRGANLENTDNNNNTALLTACEANDTDIVKLLLEEKVNVEARNKLGATALMSAARRGSSKMVELLLKHGANINSRDLKIQSTPLIEASIYGHVDVVKVLIRFKADLEAKDKNGHNALHCASYCRKASLKVMDLLIEAGLNINGLTGEGESPLLITCSANAIEKTKFLLSFPEVDLQSADKNGLSPLHHAVVHGTTEMVSVLLAQGVDKDAVDLDGSTALMSACRKRNKNATIELLLQQGANMDMVDNDGWTALTRAACCGYLDIVKLLIDYGANIEQPTSYGMTALMGAIDNGQCQVVDYLLSKNAKLSMDIDQSLHGLFDDLEDNLELTITDVESIVVTLFQHGVPIGHEITMQFRIVPQLSVPIPQEQSHPQPPKSCAEQFLQREIEKILCSPERKRKNGHNHQKFITSPSGEQKDSHYENDGNVAPTTGEDESAANHTINSSEGKVMVLSLSLMLPTVAHNPALMLTDKVSTPPPSTCISPSTISVPCFAQ